ncbi:MAG: aminotransferase class IV [Chitinophagaceae bacterium]|nr:aminotransferase class IV [Chitinophagaceae bacterium]
MRFHNGTIPLWDLHWQRLSKSLPQLYFELPAHFTETLLKTEVERLAKKNNAEDAARIRITVFKGEGGIWEKPSSSFHYLIQCWPLENNVVRLNENGLEVGLFEDGKKSCDKFSHLKTNNYLLYTLAAQFAKKEKLNECFILNQYGRLSDATIANVFFIKDNGIHTPRLDEGCINGVMRWYLLDQLSSAGYNVKEGTCLPSEIEAADEVFLTNAMNGIRWVKSFGSKTYHCQQTAELFRQFISPLFL